jgi:hypothetical protein
LARPTRPLTIAHRRKMPRLTNVPEKREPLKISHTIEAQMVLINAHTSQPSRSMFETGGSMTGRRAHLVRSLESPRQNLTPIQLVALRTASELQGCSAIADACCWTTRNVALRTYTRATSSRKKSYAETRPSAADKNWPLFAKRRLTGKATARATRPTCRCHERKNQVNP